MKQFTRMIATLLLGVMLMTTLTGCNRYYYYYYINVFNSGSGSSDDDDFSSFPPDDSNSAVDSNWFTDLSGYGTGSTTDGNPSNLTKAWARLMESVIPWHIFNDKVLNVKANKENWVNRTYQGVTVVASETADTIAKECGLALENTMNGDTPVMDSNAMAAVKNAVSKYGENYNMYFAGIIEHGASGSPRDLSSDMRDFGGKTGRKLIGISTDSNPNEFSDFIKFYSADRGRLLYTLGTYRINEKYIVLVISG